MRARLVPVLGLLPMFLVAGGALHAPTLALVGGPLPTIPGLSADYLDGMDSGAFALADHNHDERYYTQGVSDDRFINGNQVTVCDHVDSGFVHADGPESYGWAPSDCTNGAPAITCVGMMSQATTGGISSSNWAALGSGAQDYTGNPLPNGGMVWHAHASGAGIGLRALYLCP